MPRAEHPRPGIRKSEAVSAGDLIQIAVEGGYVRRPAPADGVMLYTAAGPFFISWHELDALRKGNANKKDR